MQGRNLWRRLRRLEAMAHRAAEQYCNGEIELAAMDAMVEGVTRAVGNVLGQVPRGFFVNRDPRGYALKLDPDFMVIPEGMQKDWGGYGLLAAEIE